MVNKYDQKHKEKLWKKAHKRCQNLSEEEKEKRHKKAWDRYQNLSEKDKEKSINIIVNIIRIFLKKKKEKKVEYMKNYYLAHKKDLLSWFVDFWDPVVILFHELVLEMLKKVLKIFNSFGDSLL